MSPIAALGWLAMGPAIELVTVVLLGVLDIWVHGPVSLLILFCTVTLACSALPAVHVLWSSSAYLDVHAAGIVLGRAFSGGRPRAVRFTELSPTTLRLVSRSRNLLPTMRFRMSAFTSRWLYLAPGADLAVTVLGPDCDSDLGAAPRSPVHLRGMILFSSARASEVADELRAGLERAGCPPELAREYLRHGVVRLPHHGADAEDLIPGMPYRPRR